MATGTTTVPSPEVAPSPEPVKAKRKKAAQKLPAFVTTLSGVLPNGIPWKVEMGGAKAPCGCKGCKGIKGVPTLTCNCVIDKLANCSDRQIEAHLRSKPGAWTKEMFLAVRGIVRGSAELYGIEVPDEQTENTKKFLAEA